MKNRKTVVVAFLLVAAMLLSVGYAALTDTLAVDGTLNLSADSAQDAFDADVYFQNANAAGKANGDTITISADKDTVTFEVNSLKEAGKTTTFTYEIQNDNAFAVKVTPDTIVLGSNNAGCFSVTSSFTAVETIAAGDKLEVTVTVTLVKIPATNDTALTVDCDQTYSVAAA